MLPKIEQRNNWGSDKLSSHTCPVESQPKGAGGEELGATGIVTLDILLEETGKTLTVPCFVLEPSKPIWQEAMRNCGVILGTNATVGYGVQVVHENGTVVKPAVSDSTVSCKEVLCVTLSQVVHLAPQQTKVVRSTVKGADSNRQSSTIGVVTPSEATLAQQQCDMEKILWTGESSTQVVMYNWGLEAQTIEEGQVVGEVQLGTVVAENDPVWNDTSIDESLCVQHIQDGPVDDTRRLELQGQLQIGSQRTESERMQLEELLLSVFALQDSELGETDLVTHTIDTGNAKPVQTCPRRLPYVLRRALEQELPSLLNTGCIKPSSSPYTSALVLVRKKNGALRVCVNYRR